MCGVICLPKKLHEWPGKKAPSPNRLGQVNFQVSQLILLLQTLTVERWVTRQSNTHELQNQHSCSVAASFCWQLSLCVAMARQPGTYNFPRSLVLSFHWSSYAHVKMASEASKKWQQPSQSGWLSGRNNSSVSEVPVRCSSARCRFCLVRSCSPWSFALGCRWKKHSCLVEGGTRCPLGRADRWYLPAVSSADLWAGQKFTAKARYSCGLILLRKASW